MTRAGHLVDLVVDLGIPEERTRAAGDIGRALGGDRLIVFVRDDEVGVLLPAPGFPKTFRDAAAWHRFLDDCVAHGERIVDALPIPEGGEAVPAFGFSCGRDVVAVVLGAARASPHAGDVRRLLPLVASTVRGERAASNARVQVRLAEQAAAHAEALARSLDATRVNLQRANAALETARAAAEAANRAKSEFLTTMSHELRTPLNAIAGHVQLIELGVHGPVTEAQRESLRRVDRSQRHLLRLINEVLNLARIEAGRVEYLLDDVPVREVIADVRPMIEPQLQAKSLGFEAAVVADVVLRADREKLQQVLLNLLANAAKFTPTGGFVTISGSPCEAHPECGAIRVCDNGIGIPAGKLEAIFEPFVQVDASHSREGQGAGLGLAISRDLVRGMGGDLTVESTLGAGSTFTVVLPMGQRVGGGR